MNQRSGGKYNYKQKQIETLYCISLFNIIIYYNSSAYNVITFVNLDCELPRFISEQPLD